MRKPLGLIASAILISVLTGAVSAQTTRISSDDALKLRNAVLSIPSKELSRDTCVVIMDVPEANEIASVMSSSEGDASVYYSSGGAIIGGGALRFMNIPDRAKFFALGALRVK